MGDDSDVAPFGDDETTLDPNLADEDLSKALSNAQTLRFWLGWTFFSGLAVLVILQAVFVKQHLDDITSWEIVVALASPSVLLLIGAGILYRSNPGRVELELARSRQSLEETQSDSPVQLVLRLVGLGDD